MDDMNGKVVVVTGGGSGIGEGMVHAFADAGAHVVVADIEGDAAERVAEAAERAGAKSLAVQVDVADAGSVAALADRAYQEFGEVNVLCNNAGVLLFRPALEMTQADWDWLLAVNLRGVINGVQTFAPRMKEQPGEAHIVNTASINGLFASPITTLGYHTTKYAVVGLTEALALELEPEGIGVTCLCPAGVRTKILAAERNRQPEFGGAEDGDSDREALLATALDPRVVGDLVVEGVKARRRYVFTSARVRDQLEERHQRLIEDLVATSPDGQ